MISVNTQDPKAIRYMKKHEGIRYPCDQCEYTTTDLSVQKGHKKSKHEGSDIPVISVNIQDPESNSSHKRKHEGFNIAVISVKYAVN